LMGGQTTNPGQSCSVLLYLTAGQWVKARVLQNTGGNLDVVAEGRSNFGMVYVGE